MIVESIEIDPDAVDPDDVEMLQDLVLSAVNGAMEKAQELASSKMGAITGGLKHTRPYLELNMQYSSGTPPVQRLIEEFSRLPGIGPKSAQRLDLPSN